MSHIHLLWIVATAVGVLWELGYVDLEDLCTSATSCQKNKDRKVLYQGYGKDVEEGVISSWNSAYIFVRFGSSITPQACYPEQLEFI